MHSPPCNGHDTSPASHRRPPAIIGPHRAMDSCGVGAFSLNYGPQTTRGKSPYVSGPCLSRAVPTTRDRTVQPHTTIKRYPCRERHSPFGTPPHEIVRRFRASPDFALTRSRSIHHPRAGPTLASCNGARDSRRSRAVSPRRRRVRCPARPAKTGHGHTRTIARLRGSPGERPDNVHATCWAISSATTRTKTSMSKGFARNTLCPESSVRSGVVPSA